MKTRNTRLTILFCYLGSFIQAIVINLAPVLFIPLRSEFGLSFEEIGRLILINFTTQVAFDIVCGFLVDRIGAKPFIVAGNILCAAGLWLFALAPTRFASPYAGLVLATIVFSMGAGIFELLLSPILNALPSDQKANDMALMHSFYAWGQATVILVTTITLYLIGEGNWRYIALAWSVLPLIGAFGFAQLHIPRFQEETQRHHLRDLVRIPSFLIAVAAIGLGGASELSIGQWTSAFAEEGLGLPKIVGDVGGVVLFAVALGLGRVWFGIWGSRVSLYRPMIAGAATTVLCYLVASLSPWPFAALAGCVLAGLSVSLLWPGMLSITAARFPLAGASMFALMSASGDIGGAVAPWLVGAVADRAPLLAQLSGTLLPAGLTAEQIGLRTGLLFAAIYPLILVVLLLRLRAEARQTARLPEGLPAA